MNKEILRLAIPNILSNISVPLLSTVDTALMGRLSEMHIGAVGVGSMIFTFVYWNFVFLRMGTTGITAQAYGKQDNELIMQTLGRAWLVGLSLSLLFVALQAPIGQIAFPLMNVDGAQEALVAEYFYIRIWAAPASIGLYVMMGWFFGMQNPIFPLILTIFINVINITLSYYLVYILGWEVRGVAMGTLIAQYAGLALSFVLFFLRYGKLTPDLHLRGIIQWDALKGFLLINRDIFLRTLALTLVFSSFFSQSARFGSMLLAVNTILIQFLYWMAYAVDGFAFAAEAVVGKYAGAGKRLKAMRAVRLTFVWGMGFAVLYSLAYWLAGPSLLYVFTDQADVRAAVMPYLGWIILLPLVGAPSYLWDGVYVGIMASKAMRNTMLIAFLGFLITYLLSYNYLGNHGLWLSMIVFLLVRGAAQHWMFWRKGLELG